LTAGGGSAILISLLIAEIKMVAINGKIKKLGTSSLAESVQILHLAFGKVTAQFGLTRENAPVYAAFTTVEKVNEMRDRGAVFYGYFLGRKQVGVVALEKRESADSPYRGEYFMERLAVLPEYWHTGIGRELVNYIIARTGDLGVKKLFLAMVNENKVLKKWYEGMGFKEVGIRKFEGLPFSVCFMSMDI
jgi:ribosomal protein S18 acetylase RimI-like enzyme